MVGPTVRCRRPGQTLVLVQSGSQEGCELLAAHSDESHVAAVPLLGSVTGPPTVALGRRGEPSLELSRVFSDKVAVVLGSD